MTGGNPHISSQLGSTSHALISDVKKASPEAWSELVRLYTPLICYWCRQVGVSEADVPDLTQEVFRSLSSAISKFQHDRQGDTLRGWLRTITAFWRTAIDGQMASEVAIELGMSHAAYEPSAQ